MVFQNYALYPHMTVFENIAFGLRVKKVPNAEVRQRILDIYAKTGFEGIDYMANPKGDPAVMKKYLDAAKQEGATPSDGGWLAR
jgi:ABC-type transporter Mla maintaining outer membrane lipid asymmetry ATPase subunit MlaF